MNKAHPSPTTMAVTLVHGTWGRGIIPAFRLSKKPRWFEAGSPFRSRLEAELRKGGTDFRIEPFVWSGANSIRHRDMAAKDLAIKISDIEEEHQVFRHIIIAHSHGGNVVARALRLYDDDIQHIFVCYMATPFLQLFPRKVGFIEAFIVSASVAMFVIIMSLPLAFIVATFIKDLFLNSEYYEKRHLIWIVSPAYIVGYAIFHILYDRLRSGKAQIAADTLIDSTLSVDVNRRQGPILILRAIDDEASLALSAGTIANIISYKFLILSASFLLVLQTFGQYAYVYLLNGVAKDYFSFLNHSISPVLIPIFTFTLFLSTISRGVFGRELLYNLPGTQMNVQSVPDFARKAHIVTLLRSESGGLGVLRHGIYDHASTVHVITEWIRKTD